MYQYAQITGSVTYKGHKIDKVESLLQIVYVIDGETKKAYWSMSDAKRAINGKANIFLPVDITNWFD